MFGLLACTVQLLPELSLVAFFHTLSEVHKATDVLNWTKLFYNQEGTLDMVLLFVGLYVSVRVLHRRCHYRRPFHFPVTLS